MNKFPNKRIVITGAGSGLGRTMAIDFAKRNWRVCVSDISLERAEETIDRISSFEGLASGCMAIQCDVTKWDQVFSMADMIVSRWGGIDIIVNNAGVITVGIMEKIPIEDWKWIIDINLMGVVHGCKAFVPILKKQGVGHIVNIASFAGLAAPAELSAYNVTKAGIVSLSETLETELYNYNIGVTVVCPSIFKTNLMNQARFTDKSQKNKSIAIFQNSKTTAEDVSRYILKCIKNNRFHALPQMDARLTWKLKRHFPVLHSRLSGFLYVHMDKLLKLMGIQTEKCLE